VRRQLNTVVHGDTAGWRDHHPGAPCGAGRGAGRDTCGGDARAHTASGCAAGG
jgi:hypothetical protein